MVLPLLLDMKVGIVPVLLQNLGIHIYQLN